MRLRYALLFATSLVVCACEGSEELDEDAGAVLPGPGNPGGGLPGAGAGGPGSTGGPGGGLADAAIGSADGGGGWGALDTGVGPDPSAFGDGSTPGSTAGGGDAAVLPDSGGPSVSGPEPNIPQPGMACPVFQSGETTIMGLTVKIFAGPKSTTQKGPLVFYWHGTGSTGDEVESSPFGGADAAGLPAEVRAEIMAEGGIIIAPTDGEAAREGEDVTFLLGVWYTPGDLKLADLIVACAVEQHNIDPRRIYTTGCSAGGLMSGVMAFHRSSYLAASAPNSGGVAPIPGMTTFQDMNVPALMTMHGANDWVIVDFPTTSREANMAIVAEGGFAINCNHGGGHCGAPKELKLAMWRFMKDHPFGVSPEPYANGLPSVFPSYCQIFTD